MRWLRDFQCKASFICTHLDYNICGDYGIKISTSGGDSGSVCYENYISQATVEPGTEMEMELWYESGAKFNATCYFWCTEDGNLPSKFDDSNFASDDLLENLVKIVL